MNQGQPQPSAAPARATTRRAILGAILLLGCAALFLLQHTRAIAPFSPAPLLYLVADTEREAERIPLAATRVSDAKEIQVGEKIAREYRLIPPPNRPLPPPDPETARILLELNRVGGSVALHVRRHAIPYHFYLDSSPNLVNAFALPGGHIVVGHGLLALLESEDELAAILGHEITHVDNRHAIERLQYELASRKIGLDGLYSLGRPAVQLFEAGYTKEQELEADRVGLGFAVAAGYSPEGGINVMKRFEKFEAAYDNRSRAASPIEEMAGIPLGTLEQYFRSHPRASDRRSALESEARSRGWNGSLAVRPLPIRDIFLTEAAEKLNAEGNFSTAVARFQEAVALNPKNVRAWRGLAETSWRSGDAAETERAAKQALQLEATVRLWHLIALSLAVSDPDHAVERFEAVGRLKPVVPFGELYLTPDIELAGLKLLRGDPHPFDSIRSSVTSLEPLHQARARREIAFWMYRAGRSQDALTELEAARQAAPQSYNFSPLVWILSDLGRQADAQQALAFSPVDLPYSTPVESSDQEERAAVFAARGQQAERAAALAVIDWRTGQHDPAAKFREAAAADPVWMIHMWPEFNFSRETTTIIRELQSLELARRVKELRDRQQQQQAQRRQTPTD